MFHFAPFNFMAHHTKLDYQDKECDEEKLRSDKSIVEIGRGAT